MKWSKVALAAALFGALSGVQAWAQIPSSKSTGYYFVADPNPASPSDAAAMTGDAPAAAPAEEPKAEEEAPEEEEDTGPLRLFPQGEHCWNAYGFVNGGYAVNNHGPGVAFNGPVTFYDRNNQGSLNQLYGILEKTVVRDECCWDVGGRIDYIYGWDSRFTTEVGWELDTGGGAKWNAADAYYGQAIPQAYLEFAKNNWSIKAGRFYTIIGYEGVMATSNFFPTHAYTMQYGEPFTHTGVIANKTVSECFNYTVGVVNGWDSFDRSRDGISVIGGGTYAPTDKLTFTLNGIVGPERRQPPPDNTYANRFMYSFVMTWVMNDCWTYVLQHDYAKQDTAGIDFTGAPPVAPGQSAEWYGLNQYLFRTINDCWKLGVRGEIFRDDDGYRVGALHPNNPIGGGFAGNFYEAAIGANYTPHKNVVVRPELRWDWYDGLPGRGTGNLPYGDGVNRNQFMFVVDAIVHF